MLKEYQERFDEIFPTEEYGADFQKYIKECLEKNKPIKELYPIEYGDNKY